MIDVAIIGGGQAGLAAGQQFQQAGKRILILDASARTGDSWRNRFDSLRLFTAIRYNHLPGFNFPGDLDAYPSKDEAADYLE
jgi:putative flavoprotein involved in K+ transport